MKNELSKRIILVCLIALFLALIYIFIGCPMLAFVGDYNALQQYIAQKGVSGFILVGFFIVVQTLSTCIPGTPFYLASGFVVGGFKGALFCDLCATIGNTIAFLLGKIFGKKLLNYLFTEEKIKNVTTMMGDKNPKLIHALFMLLPLPKDTYAWLGYTSGEGLLSWILMTFICRFPHIFVYTFGGQKLLEQQYGILVFGAVFAILVYAIVLLRIKKKSSLHNEQ